MAIIKKFIFNPFQENTYLIYDESKECVIIDAGCMDENEFKQINSFIVDNGLKPARLLNTHCHFDHILGNHFFTANYNLEVEANTGDAFLMNNAEGSALAFGIKAQDFPPISKNLKNGQEITFGNTTLKVRETPGHSPGHVVFYNEADKAVFVGDVLFRDSIGRTDLPGGDYDILMQSIKTQLLTLPEEVEIHSGHGTSSSIGMEIKSNAFLADI